MHIYLSEIHFTIGLFKLSVRHHAQHSVNRPLHSNLVARENVKK